MSSKILTESSGANDNKPIGGVGGCGAPGPTRPEPGRRAIASSARGAAEQGAERPSSLGSYRLNDTLIEKGGFEWAGILL
jgi:hypothetical protein